MRVPVTSSETARIDAGSKAGMDAAALVLMAPLQAAPASMSACIVGGAGLAVAREAGRG